jgi:hypothetical protein
MVHYGYAWSLSSYCYDGPPNISHFAAANFSHRLEYAADARRVSIWARNYPCGDRKCPYGYIRVYLGFPTIPS